MSSIKPQWQQDLEKNGYAVVKGAVPVERALAYSEAGTAWLESFQQLGFKRDDASTWDAAHLPDHYTGGLFTGYSCSHEKWVWECRTEPKVVEVFEQLWKTKELIVSYDAINVSLPQGEGKRVDVPITAPWPHIDQQPGPVGRPALEFELAQGLVACSESGPEDGGLVVVPGSHLRQKEFFAATGGIKAEQDSGERNYYTYSEKDMEWWTEQGHEVLKVESQPGDLILWDSRTIHWNRSPKGDRTRVVVYVCMCPTSYIDAETLKKKQGAFANWRATTHWPQYAIIPVEEYGPPQRDGKADPYDRAEPLEKPVLTERLLQLAGVKAY